MKESDSFTSPIPASIIIGSVLISLSILISSGVLKIKGVTPTPLGVGGGQLQAGSSPDVQPTPAPKVDVELGNIPVKGSSNAKVGVVEFADMRCPFCKRFFDQAEPQLLENYVNTGKVKFAFRHFEFLGPASITAGNAVECANEQGKFWDFYDFLYKNQPDESDVSMYTTDKLTATASSLGLNSEQFRSCLSSTKYSKNLTDDQSAGQQAGVTGTPTFIIGKLNSSGDKIISGQVLVGAQPYSALQTIIDQELR